MVLHPACHDDPVEFYNLHGFYPDNLRSRSLAGEGRLMFITLMAATLAYLGLAVPGWGGLAAFFSHLVQSLSC